MKTTFSQARMDFTKRAHLAAQTQFYPGVFPGLPITFEDTVGTVKDLEYAIDCRLAVAVEGLRAPIYFSVQERWRDPKEMGYGDVTITEWNRASDQPSELHKLGAQLFVYGFYDDPGNRVVFAVAVDVLTVLRRLALRQLQWRRRNRIDQTFLGFEYRHLETIGAVVHRYDGREPAAELTGEISPPVRKSGSGAA